MSQGPLHLYASAGGRGPSAIDTHRNAWWRNTENDPWQQAVFHNTIRQALIAEAAQHGSYTSPRTVGPWGDDDVTSYHPGQDWGLVREHRPPKTYQINRTRETEPTEPVPIWFWRGSVVLDYQGHPILAYDALPATLGSKEDGCFLEGMFREDPGLTWADFAARFPVGHPPMIYLPVVDKRLVAMRRLRFRLQAGCISWTQRDGTKDMQAEIEKLLPPECLQLNSTRGFRDLTPYEQKKVQAASRRKHPEREHPERAGDRAISEDKREAVDRAFAASMERAKHEHDSERARKPTLTQPTFNSSESFEKEIEREDHSEVDSWPANQHRHLTSRPPNTVNQYMQRRSTASSEDMTEDYWNDIAQPPAHATRGSRTLGEQSALSNQRPSIASASTQRFSNRHQNPTRSIWFPHTSSTGAPQATSNLPTLRPSLRTIAGSAAQQLSNLTPAIDYREIVPVNAEEQAVVSAAADATRQHLEFLFREVTGTNQSLPQYKGLSYRAVYDSYTRMWQSGWAMSGGEGSAPPLKAVTAACWCSKFPSLHRSGKVFWFSDLYEFPRWYGNHLATRSGRQV